MKRNLWFSVFMVVLLTLTSMAATPSDDGTAAQASLFGGGSWVTPKRDPRPDDSRPVLESAWRADIPDANVVRSTDQLLTDVLPKLSGDAANLLATKYQLPELEGKKIDWNNRQAGTDHIVAANNYVYENEPSMAVNPMNEQIVVVFTHYYNDTGVSGSCQAMISYDGGESFDYNDYYFPPMPNGGSCSDPVVRFSPDGFFVYYFYMDVYDPGGGEVADIIMQRASGFAPATAAGAPVNVLSSGGLHFLDKEWGDVHTFADPNTPGSEAVLYTSATKFYSNGDCAIVFNVSYDYGATWTYVNTNPLVMVGSVGCTDVVQGSRPIGTFNGFMTVCWYWSQFDGYLAGGYSIECAANDHYSNGVWSPFYYPVFNRKYELANWLGPNESFYRWRGGMFPALAVDEYGALYVTSTHDPTTSDLDTEAGNVILNRRYLDYAVVANWNAPMTIGSGTTAQGYATVAAHFDPMTNKAMIIVAYHDHTAGNTGYYIVYRKLTRAANSYSMSAGGKIRISDRWSVSDYLFIGDYIDSGMTSRRYHVVWTDRADAYSKMDFDDDVLHDYFTP